MIAIYILAVIGAVVVAFIALALFIEWQESREQNKLTKQAAKEFREHKTQRHLNHLEELFHTRRINDDMNFRSHKGKINDLIDQTHALNDRLMAVEAMTTNKPTNTAKAKA